MHKRILNTFDIKSTLQFCLRISISDFDFAFDCPKRFLQLTHLEK